MKPLTRIAFIGNHLPRRCGIATFTHDLHRAVAAARPELDTCVVAMTDSRGDYDYPECVRREVRDEIVDDYVRAAAILNAERFDVVSLQHEFGIFGGAAGGHIVEMLSRLEMPIVTTLHTVLQQPSSAQRAVMDHIVERSTKLVVMANKARELLRSTYEVPADKIAVIAHGIPDYPYIEPDLCKAKLGFAGKTVMLTFGLLSPTQQGHRNGHRRHARHSQILSERRLRRARRNPSQSRPRSGRSLSGNCSPCHIALVKRPPSRPKRLRWHGLSSQEYWRVRLSIHRHRHDLAASPNAGPRNQINLQRLV